MNFLAGLGLAGGLVAAQAGSAAEAPDNCSHTVIARAAAPGGGASAIVDEAVCDAGLGGDVTAQVLLQPGPDAPAVAILGVDTGGYAEDRPRVAWQGAAVLRVTVPNLSYLKILRRDAGGVAVQVVFDPPDAAARAAWLKQERLPPD